MNAIWPWIAGGVAWWVAAFGATLPYRRRHRAAITVLRLTLGLPLTVAAWLEAARSRRRKLPWERKESGPYRVRTVLWLSLVVAEALAAGAWLVSNLL